MSNRMKQTAGGVDRGRDLFLVAALMLVLVCLAATALSAAGQPAPATVPPPARGSASAPVRIELFVDLACPWSARVFRLAEELAAEYGPEKVRLIVHPLARYGAPSDYYHRALAAAARRGKGFEFASEMFASQRLWLREAPFSAFEENRAFDSIVGPLATRLQLDPEQLKKDMTDETVRFYLRQEAELGEGKKVRATPACFVNERAVAQVLDKTLWRQMIEATPSATD